MATEYVKCPRCDEIAPQPELVYKVSKYGTVYTYKRYRHYLGDSTKRPKECYVRIGDPARTA